MNKVYVGLAAGILVTAAMTCIALQGPRSGLPAFSDLGVAEGTLQTASQRKGTVYFSLSELPDKFTYSSKADAGDRVFIALRPGVSTKVWHEPQPSNYQVGKRYLEVFQIEVDGQLIRTYDEVAQSWIANNKLAPWIAGVSAILVVYFVAYIGLAWRKDRGIS